MIRTMATVNEAVDTYIATWNEFDEGKRRRLITEGWAEQASYTDPHYAVRGHDEIDAMIAGAQTQFADHSIALAAGPDAHHDRARFVWHLLPPGGGEPLVVGVDVAIVDASGRISEVSGFRGVL